MRYYFVSAIAKPETTVFFHTVDAGSWTPVLFFCFIFALYLLF